VKLSYFHLQNLKWPAKCTPNLRNGGKDAEMPRECVAMARNTEQHLNWLLAMVHSKGHENASMVQKWLQGNRLTSHSSEIWASVYPCMSVISNGKTPAHRDQRGMIDFYDLLLCIGNAEDITFELPELGVAMQYNPRTVIFICGRGLKHAVPAWDASKERCCWAHFIRQEHFDALSPPLSSSGWVKRRDFDLQ
jgi:hypothetical protein